MADESGNISISKESIWKYSTIILLAVLVVGAFVFFSNSTGKTPTGNVVAGNGQAVKIDSTNAPIKGSKDAKVTMIEFSDFECPFCGRHFLQTYPQIVKNYVDTGKMNFMFMDFPLSFHPSAQKAAESAEAVRAQLGDTGYWQMHDKLYSNQESLSIENYKKWARELGVDGEQFDKDLDSGKYAGAVKSDMNIGQAAGVSGTPAFFINGKSIVGACPYSTFKQAIDAELAGQNWSVDNCVFSQN